jgi:hypothetical protein
MYYLESKERDFHSQRKNVYYRRKKQATTLSCKRMHIIIGTRARRTCTTLGRAATTPWYHASYALP